jgi:hypothetical protein
MVVGWIFSLPPSSHLCEPVYESWASGRIPSGEWTRKGDDETMVRFKFTQSLRPSAEQLAEISEIANKYSDFRLWNYNHDHKNYDLIKDHSVEGKYGIYYIRINLSWYLTTILDIY